VGFLARSSTHAPARLDLQGGTQVTLVPKSANGGGDVTPEQLEQSVEIIRQRVNGLGVSEAEVTTQGSGGSSAIIVSVPGENRQGLEQQLSQTALLDFGPWFLKNRPPRPRRRNPVLFPLAHDNEEGEEGFVCAHRDDSDSNSQSISGST
jgi:preprotein translocase subunit SecD